MSKLILYLFAALAAVSVITYPLWFPGLTREQTGQILLSDYKFGSRANWKAKMHGPPMIRVLGAQTDDFSKLDAYQASVVTRLIQEFDTRTVVGYGRSLFESQGGPLRRAVGALIVLRDQSSRARDPEMLRVLSEMSLDPEIVAGGSAGEVAIAALGEFGGESAFEVLAKVLDENDVPYERHDAACRAIARTSDARAIPILQRRMLDENFKALVPALNALQSLGDTTALSVAKRRLAMGYSDADRTLLEEQLRE